MYLVAAVRLSVHLSVTALTAEIIVGHRIHCQITLSENTVDPSYKFKEKTLPHGELMVRPKVQ